MVWGQFSLEAVNDKNIFPFYSLSETIIVGNSKINYSILSHKKYNNISNLKKILFISTKIYKENFSYDSIEIMSNVENNYSSTQKFKVLYKFHPAEDISEYSNFNVDEPGSGQVSKSTLYDLILECDVVVGTISTALFEAMTFNKPVIQIVPKKFVDDLDIRHSVYNSGIQHVNNEQELNDVLTKLLNDKVYTSNYIKNQWSVVDSLFGNYKYASLKIANKVESLCSKNI